MRCNCNCNRNCNRNCNDNMRPQNFNQMQNYRTPSAFAAVTTDAVTATTASPIQLPFENILFSYGCAIRSTNGASTIYITQPGLYQVSYFINADRTSEGGPITITASVLRNSTSIATTTATIDGPGTEVLADTEVFYVSCQELPLSLSLQVTSDLAATVDYTYFLTVNKICDCNGNTSGFGGSDSFLCNDFIGCRSGFGGFDDDPGLMIGGFNNGFSCGCNGDWNGGCNRGCMNRCNNGCDRGCF